MFRFVGLNIFKKLFNLNSASSLQIIIYQTYFLLPPFQTGFTASGPGLESACAQWPTPAWAVKWFTVI